MKCQLSVEREKDKLKARPDSADKVALLDSITTELVNYAGLMLRFPMMFPSQGKCVYSFFEFFERSKKSSTVVRLWSCEIFWTDFARVEVNLLLTPTLEILDLCFLFPT